MNHNKWNAITLWTLTLLSLLGITLFAFVEVINVLLQQPVDPKKLTEIWNDVNPFEHANDIRVIYMLVCFIPLIMLLFCKSKAALWSCAVLIAVLTIVNSMDAIEHLMEGDLVFSIVFLCLVSGFGLLTLLFTIRWAKEE